MAAGMNDPVELRKKLVVTRKLKDPGERAARLYVLGKAILDCDEVSDEDLADAMKALNEAVALGSPHAAYDLACILLSEVESPAELSSAVALLEKAAAAGLEEAKAMLDELASE